MRTSNVGCNFTPREKGVPLNSILNIGSLSKWDQFPSLGALRASFPSFFSSSFWQHGFPCVGTNIGPQETGFWYHFYSQSWTCQILNYISILAWALLYCEVGSVSVPESLVGPNNVVGPGGLNAFSTKCTSFFSQSYISLTV